MNRCRKALLAIGVVVCLAAWLPWKSLVTQKMIPTSGPAVQGSRQVLGTDLPA